MIIAIADDDQNLLTMLVPHLEYQGHTVLLAVNGGEFIKKISEKKVDLLVADINMPVLDGIEIYEKAREMPQYASTPFILWSGIEVYKGPELAEKDLKLRFIKKPFSLAALHDCISALTELPFGGEYDPGGGSGLRL
jgi:CheY-like chemotaxis protein